MRGVAAWLSLGLAASAAAQDAPLAPAAADSPAAALTAAAAQGDAAAVDELLLELRVDPSLASADGTTALHWAVRRGDAAVVDRLLAAGAQVDARNRYGVTPLEIAVEQGDSATVRRLLAAGAAADAPNSVGEPPLLWAARVGVADSVRALLERGAEVDQRDRAFGQTALMIAAREGHADVAALLLDAGADVNARTNPAAPPRFIPPSESPPGLSKGVGIIRAGWPDGRGKRFPAAGSKSALLYATREGHLDVARVLLARGAATELADGNGVTPLLNAIVNASIIRSNRTGKSAHLAIAHTLLDAGANPNASDWYGQTPLWAAVDMRNLELGPTNNERNLHGESFALIERLLALGADVNARTREFPHERRYIVVAVGSVAWVDLTGQTPFLRAAAAGDLPTMRLLLEHGADPNLATDAGTTPLMVAAGVNWTVGETFDHGSAALLEAVKLTLELGNDVNARNSMGITAVHGAANRGANDVIEYLAANGARLDVADAHGRTPLDWAEGVFLATHPPVRKPETIALLERLIGDRASAR